MLKPKNVIYREDKGEIVEAEGGGTMTKVYCTAIVLAAGSGKRMGTKVHKQYLQLCEKPVLAYSLQAFQQSDLIDEIILVVGKGEEEFCRTEIVEKYGFFKVQIIEHSPLISRTALPGSSPLTSHSTKLETPINPATKVFSGFL